MSLSEGQTIQPFEISKVKMSASYKATKRLAMISWSFQVKNY